MKKWWKNNTNKVQVAYALTKPVQYQKWQMIGKLLVFNDSLNLAAQPKPYRDFYLRYSRSWSGIVGLLIFLFLFLGAIIIPFTTTNPNTIRAYSTYLPFFSYDQTTQVFFLLGTDNLGRDLWAQLWHGLRFSILLSLLVTLIEVSIGVSIGLLMGHFYLFDKIMTFVIKVLTIVPTIIILITITIVLNPTFWTLVFALTLTSWTGMANQIRAQVRRAKSFEWVAASRVLGTPFYKVLSNYLPITIPILVTQLIFSIPGVILAETSLAFIGLSLPGVATLGNMIADGSKIFLTYARFILVPSSLLVLITAAIQMIGATIQDVLVKKR